MACSYIFQKWGQVIKKSIKMTMLKSKTRGCMYCTVTYINSMYVSKNRYLCNPPTLPSSNKHRHLESHNALCHELIHWCGFRHQAPDRIRTWKLAEFTVHPQEIVWFSEANNTKESGILVIWRNRALPRNLQQDPLFTDPEKTWVSNSSSNLLRGLLVRSHSIFDGMILETETPYGQKW